MIRRRTLDGMGVLTASFPATHPFATLLENQQELRVYHRTEGFVGAYAIRGVDQALHDSNQVVRIKCYDLLIELAETSTFNNRNYNGVPVEDILSDGTITDNPDGLLRGTHVTSEVEAGLGDFVASFSGESRLGAVASLANRLKKHFRLKPASAGQPPVLEFGSFGADKDVTLTGISAITDSFYRVPGVLPITNIQKVTDQFDRADYLQPFGSGAGPIGFTLQFAQASDLEYPIRTFVEPDGSTGYYVRYVNTPDLDTTSPGGSAHFYTFKESSIRPVTNSPGDVARAADALYKTTVEHLKIARIERVVYTLSLGGSIPPSLSVTVGDSVRVVYRGVVERGFKSLQSDKLKWVDIQGRFIVTSIEEHFTSEGGVETSLTVSTIGEGHESDGTLVLDLRRRTDVLEKYTQLSINIIPLSYDTIAEPDFFWQDKEIGGESDLSGAFAAGVTDIVVAESQATGFSVGDYIRIGDRDEIAMEVYKIEAVDRPNRRLTLDVPLLTDHANDQEVVEQENSLENVQPLIVPVSLAYYDLQRVSLYLSTRRGKVTSVSTSITGGGEHDHVSTLSATADDANRHSHGIQDNTHSHGIQNSEHSHGIHNSSHSHGIHDGGNHSHGINDGGSHNHGRTDSAATSASNAGNHSHNVSFHIGDFGDFSGATASGGTHGHSNPTHSHSAGGDAGTHTHGQDAAGEHTHGMDTNNHTHGMDTNNHTHGQDSDTHTHGEDAVAAHSHGVSGTARTTDSGPHSHDSRSRKTVSTVFPAMLELFINGTEVTYTVEPSSARGLYGSLSAGISGMIIDLTPFFHEADGALIHLNHHVQIRPRAGFGEIIGNVEMQAVIQGVALQ